MNPQSQYALLLVLLLVLIGSYATEGARTPRSLGGWNPIQNLTTPEVQEIVEFVVKETNLTSPNLVWGESQVVNGINFRLFIVAIQFRVSGMYEAAVYARAGENFVLTSFEKLSKST
ncbi:hypothetical protein NMG60_11022553 [Bertholletia excelsa]